MNSDDKTLMLEIDSRLDCVALVGISIRALCLEYGADEMTAYQVQTSTVEAVNNTIIHAYSNQSGHPVWIRWSLADKRLTIQVSDEGMTMRQLPPDIEPEPDAESGRGWWIMRQWMDSAEYMTDSGRNTLVLSKSISNKH
ncbi:MAG TPA: ATP-binding protein [Candidatus Competibacteraceae bacterium]|nr:ATP-binding protein [Candidatus Competibacteraceae bacterium]MCP5133222.1 ATP-binding protein [Gammaproteobacteria bacterium]HPF58979.1 ATP-binding protein [Candidatus Competibacteraceae bacterium]HRY18480.1 ATP-binding protein [Candidatus Competibacteraceae bacterium]